MKQTPLHALHLKLGAKMVPFAGWEMPVSYPAGLMAEHAACRDGAALFDVSHMCQVELRGINRAVALEALVPASIVTLQEGRARYTTLTNEEGAIIDDLIVSNCGDYLYLVLNASRANVDIAHIEHNLPRGVGLVRHYEDLALIALQGPAAAKIIESIAPVTANLICMQTAAQSVDGIPMRFSRVGYTGEDGFEVALPAEAATGFAERLLALPGVTPAGLGARDTLRMEAGLCLYGQDIDETTSPIEAGLGWAIQKSRRTAADFPGAARITQELETGPSRRLVGILPEGRAPARAGTQITAADGTPIGQVTSGGFSPTLQQPISMGYVAAAHTADGTQVTLMVRGKPLPARVTPLPFVPHRYKR